MESDRALGGDVDRYGEVIRNYEYWRRIATETGKNSYDEPDWANGRLYFRSNYLREVQRWPDWDQFGEWAAWIIEPTPGGCYNVLRSLKHEREKERSDEIEVTFSKVADAGKYITLQIGDERRLALGLETLFLKWEAEGPDPRIRITAAGEHAIEDFMRRTPGISRQFLEQHLRAYILRDDPTSYAIALASQQPDIQVLAYSYAELNAMLLDGMPTDITSKFSE